MNGLTAEQLARLDEDGYLIIEDVLGADDLARIEAEYTEILDRAADGLVRRGRMRPLQGAGFSERYVEAIRQIDDLYALYQHLDISLPLIEELGPSNTLNTGPEVFRLITHPRLLDIVESVIGPEIYSNPIQHTRIKPPVHCLPDVLIDSNVGATGWHQDSAVAAREADETDMLTVWLAVTDASVENGCLVAMPGSHRTGVTLHCPGTASSSEIYIPETILDSDRAVPLEVKAGGAVLLHKMTEHGSLENRSDGIRWSFDLRYQPIGQPTGRSVFPGFAARSSARPDLVVTDHAAWEGLWRSALQRIVDGEADAAFNARWEANARHRLCA